MSIFVKPLSGYTILLRTLSGVKRKDSAPLTEMRDAEQTSDSIEDLVKEIISNATVLNSGGRRADAKKAKIMAVQQMQERGIFLIKGA